jgi:hypothetical protein
MKNIINLWWKTSTFIKEIITELSYSSSGTSGLACVSELIQLLS